MSSQPKRQPMKRVTAYSRSRALIVEAALWIGKPCTTLQTAPTKQLAIPKNAGNATRTADSGERRIRREDLDGGNGAVGGGGTGGSMGPMLSPGGSVGLGGKF